MPIESLLPFDKIGPMTAEEARLLLPLRLRYSANHRCRLPLLPRAKQPCYLQAMACTVRTILWPCIQTLNRHIYSRALQVSCETLSRVSKYNIRSDARCQAIQESAKAIFMVQYHSDERRGIVALIGEPNALERRIRRYVVIAWIKWTKRHHRARLPSIHALCKQHLFRRSLHEGLAKFVCKDTNNIRIVQIYAKIFCYFKKKQYLCGVKVNIGL